MTLTKYRYKVEQIGEGYCLDKVADKVNGVFYLCTEVDAVIADLICKNKDSDNQLETALYAVKELQVEVKLLREQRQRDMDLIIKRNTELFNLKSKPIRTHLKERISRLFTHQR